MEQAEALALVHRFEPVLRYTMGELFYPMAVEDYLAGARLVASRGTVEVLADRGTLTPDGLGRLGRVHGSRSLSLEHVDKELDRASYRRWRRRADRERFKPASRFAAVGLFSRLIDSGLRVTLLLRGSVPGGFTAAAQVAYAKTGATARPTYYAHVTTDGGYTVIQYWYLYAMNDFRSTFLGVNDHEGDWEQVSVYLVPDTDVPPHEVGESVGDGASQPVAPPLRPAWVAFSSHDEVGDDLRRRWDDPDLTLVGEHPVVFAGGGSHSGAYLPGEYLISTALPLPRWVNRVVSFFLTEDAQGALSIPYIDYKRGDGRSIGVGGDAAWNPVLVDEATPWLSGYAGLWGLDTQDPFGGERAPAGPRYNRNGTVRESWGQPVAWAGLDKVPPTEAEARERMASVAAQMRSQLDDVEDRLRRERDLLRGAYSAERALATPQARMDTRLGPQQTVVQTLRGEQRRLRALLEGAQTALAAPLPEQPVHGHLRHRAMPMGQDRTPTGRLLRIWSAVSASVLLLVLGILLLRGQASLVAILLVSAVMVLIEALLRRRLAALLAAGFIALLAFSLVWGVASLILGNLRQGFALLLILLAVYLGGVTVRELLRAR
ncbi:MAG: hypothetical protein ACOYBY_05235 [Dermatophilaceae bacterium]